MPAWLIRFALLALRRKPPHPERPFRVPLYPYYPITTISLAPFCLEAVGIFHPGLFACYLGCLAAGYAGLHLSGRRKALVH